MSAATPSFHAEMNLEALGTPIPYQAALRDQIVRVGENVSAQGQVSANACPTRSHAGAPTERHREPRSAGDAARDRGDAAPAPAPLPRPRFRRGNRPPSGAWRRRRTRWVGGGANNRCEPHASFPRRGPRGRAAPRVPASQDARRSRGRLPSQPPGSSLGPGAGRGAGGRRAPGGRGRGPGRARR